MKRFQDIFMWFFLPEFLFYVRRILSPVFPHLVVYFDYILAFNSWRNALNTFSHLILKTIRYSKNYILDLLVFEFLEGNFEESKSEKGGVEIQPRIMNAWAVLLAISSLFPHSVQLSFFYFRTLTSSFQNIHTFWFLSASWFHSVIWPIKSYIELRRIIKNFFSFFLKLFASYNNKLV